MGKALKQKARVQLKRNYLHSVLICIVFIILVGGTTVQTKNFNYSLIEDQIVININDQLLNFKSNNNSQVVIEFLQGINATRDEPKDIKATAGVLAPIVNNINKTGSFFIGTLNALNQFLFEDRVMAGIIILIGVFIGLLYWIFVNKTLLVGKKRFFLESRKYKKTKISRLFYTFKIKKNYQIAKKMLHLNITYFLHCLTIVGIFTKFYSYILVPYILAENPNIEIKDAIELSERMMMNHKWQLFKLDLSLIPHYIIGILTLNIYNLLYTTPYHELIHANYYEKRKRIAKEDNFDKIELLGDINLEGDEYGICYPKNDYVIEYEFKDWLKIDYKKNYTIPVLILLFFIFSMSGWLWEVMLFLFQTGTFVNRGTFHGPWLPIYGAGGVLIVILLKKFRDNIPLTFLLTVLVCGIVEYFTGWYLEVTKGVMYWDYTGYFLNLHGRICLEALLFFGIGGCLFVYFFAPIMDNLLKKIKDKTKLILAITLIMLFIGDFFYSNKVPNVGEGITNPVSETQEEANENKLA